MSKEVRKEEIMVDIPKRKELDMLKNQFIYMYTKIYEQFVARHYKGEEMLRMISEGTKTQPKEFNVYINNDVFKVQQSAPKTKLQFEELAEHEISDDEEKKRRKL